MKIALSILLALLILFTFLPLLKIEHWVVRLWDYPRKQALVLILIFLAVYLGLFYTEINWVLVGLSIAAIGFLIFRIIPYTSLHGIQLADTASNENTISILISNVEMQNTDFEKVVDVVLTNKPDVVMLLETDKKWQEGVSEIEKEYSFTQHQPQDDTYGVLFYSKKEIRNPEYKFLVNETIPSFHCELKIGNEWVRFYGLHPEPPFPTQSKTTVERDAEILQVAKAISKSNQPTIVAGDLNDVAWSFTTRLFQKQSRMLDPRIGRGLYSTFHADHFWARWPLDHIFVSKEFQLFTIKRLEHVGSDHFPIYIKLALTHSGKNEKPEKIDPDEKEMVKKKIEKPNED